MYKYNVTKRGPLACWILDDTIPFQECTGSNRAGTKKTGTSDPATATPLVAGASFSSVFGSSSIGKFESPVFKSGLESRPFALEAWILPIKKSSTSSDIQILSHDGIFDGLSINDKVIKFSTKYVNFGEASCTFDLQEYKMAHVVGLHSQDKNELFVNGIKVSEVIISDEQKGDSYVATDGFLYSGYTESDNLLSVNGIAIYQTLSGQDIAANYAAGIDSLGQNFVYPQFGGVNISLEPTNTSISISDSWSTIADFNRGRRSDVEFSPEAIYPSYVNDMALPGNWICGVPLDTVGDTSIYGALISWSGQAITVETSLDGINWLQATNNRLVPSITENLNPTGKDLWIRVSFPENFARGVSYLESLSVIVYRNNNILGDGGGRVTNLQYPAVCRFEHEAKLYRDDNGILLNGGSITVGIDSSGEPIPMRTVEMWIKPISTTTAIPGTGTFYRNGTTFSTPPVGEWSLVHFVASADLTSSYVLSGDYIVGQMVIYPIALTASNVSHVWKSYTGARYDRVSSAVDIEMIEGSSPLTLYSHDWSIDAGG